MDHLGSLLLVIGTMMLMIALGFLAARRGILSESGRKSVTDLVIDLIFPCYVLSSLIHNIGLLDGAEMLFVLAAGVLVQGGLLLVNCFLYRRQPPDRRAVLRYGTAVSNSAFLGLPLVGSVFGDPGLVYASIFVIALRINTFGVAVNYFHTGRKDFRGQLKAVLLQPSILATAVGIVIMLTRWRPPEWGVSVISSLAACSTPLSMLTIGAVIHAYSKEMRLDLLTAQYTLLRLILIPAALFLLFSAAGADPLLRGTAVLLGAMPAGTTMVLFADKYGQGASFAGKLVLVTTLFSMLTLPVWSYLCLTL